ncbi:ATPase domain-containing protein [Haloarcula pelagica]|uniref:ATPase domain-containing protein n=1 Tax=Haloarcula pelagica TaxID=3033389 RepID=UPI0024C3005A|nr:ATPase domain-containing protein [Halomicroarcula sp. YJ-61-S]
MADSVDVERVPSGTSGLDTVLQGGFLRGQTAIVNGGPGTGKTILALQFLAAGETGLYVGFEERADDLRRNAAALGIDLSGVVILDLSEQGSRFFSDQSYSVLSPGQAEGDELIGQIADAIDQESPDRLVIDPLTELRALLPDDYQFRRHISSLANALKERSITTVCTAQVTSEAEERDVQFLGDAAIEIRRTTDHRSLEVTKFRGSGYAGGRHTYRIRSETGGRVYPKLVPGDHQREVPREQIGSGIDALDSLLGGGVQRGSVTLISGPSGVGKTTLATVFLRAAAQRGETPHGFLFEELASDFRYRTEQLGIGIDELVESGELLLTEVESLTRSPDEFADTVRTAVEEDGARMVVIDGISGYRLGLRGGDSQDQLTRELHALCRYLKRMGVTTFLLDEIGTVTGDLMASDEAISYLADNIVFLRYVELDGEVRKVVGVLKKRYGAFEQTIRAFDLGPDGIDVGPPLEGYRGVLTGVPERVDEGD